MLDFVLVSSGDVLLMVSEHCCSIKLWDLVGELGSLDLTVGLSEGVQLVAWGSGATKCLQSFVPSKRSPALS